MDLEFLYGIRMWFLSHVFTCDLRTVYNTVEQCGSLTEQHFIE